MKASIFENNSVSHSCLLKFQFIYANLKSAELKAANFCLKHPDKVHDLTINEVAELADCSCATFVRLSKRLGYSGYSELRNKIMMPEDDNVSRYFDVSPEDSQETIVTNIFHSCIIYLEDSLKSVDFSQVSEAVRVLVGADKILFSAIGDAHFIAASSAQKFMRLGINVNASTDFDSQLIMLANMAENDVLICISHSGRTKTVCELAKIAHEQCRKVIAITNFPLSPLAKMSDIVLLTASFAYEMMDEVLAKRIPALCLLDALFACTMMEKQRKNGSAQMRNKVNNLLLNNKL